LIHPFPCIETFCKSIILREVKGDRETKGEDIYFCNFTIKLHTSLVL